MSELVMVTGDDLLEQYGHRLSQLSEAQELLADGVATAAFNHYLPNITDLRLSKAITDACDTLCPVDSKDKDVQAVRKLYFDDGFLRAVSAAISVQVDRRAINQLDY